MSKRTFSENGATAFYLHTPARPPRSNFVNCVLLLAKNAGTENEWSYRPSNTLRARATRALRLTATRFVTVLIF